MLAPYKNLKMVSYSLIGCGVVLTITVSGAILGIPAVIFGVWVYFFSTKNVAVVEGAFAEYTGTTVAAV